MSLEDMIAKDKERQFKIKEQQKKYKNKDGIKEKVKEQKKKQWKIMYAKQNKNDIIVEKE